MRRHDGGLEAKINPSNRVSVDVLDDGPSHRDGDEPLVGLRYTRPERIFPDQRRRSFIRTSPITGRRTTPLLVQFITFRTGHLQHRTSREHLSFWNVGCAIFFPVRLPFKEANQFEKYTRDQRMAGDWHLVDISRSMANCSRLIALNCSLRPFAKVFSPALY